MQNIKTMLLILNIYKLINNIVFNYRPKLTVIKYIITN